MADQVFLIVTHLINHLPTPTLHMSSPYQKFFGTPLNYSKLRVFDYLCYPWLRLYSLHKLAPRSKTYHSHHVRFIESIFHFSIVNPSLPWFDECIVSTWFLVTLIDSTPPSAPLDVDHTSNPEHSVLSSPPCHNRPASCSSPHYLVQLALPPHYRPPTWVSLPQPTCLMPKHSNP